jgi:hypothetical protein
VKKKFSFGAKILIISLEMEKYISQPCQMKKKTSCEGPKPTCWFLKSRLQAEVSWHTFVKETKKPLL